MKKLIAFLVFVFSGIITTQAIAQDGIEVIESESFVAETTAINLPLKMLIWKGENDQVHTGYNSPNYLKSDIILEAVTKSLKYIPRPKKVCLNSSWY